jgi:hypothetical protein
MDDNESIDAEEFNAQSHTKRPDLPKIEQFRAIVEARSYAEIDGIVIDMQSANAVCTVYDALNEANRVKFCSVPADKMVTIAWKLIK